MPQFWKLDATQWINPEHIIYVEDHPEWEQPTIDVTMTALQSNIQRRVGLSHTPRRSRVTPGTGS